MASNSALGGADTDQAWLPSGDARTPIGEQAALYTPNRALLTVGVMAATLMQILDSTIANVALPRMQATLGATGDTITWVLTSYIVASAVAIPVTGWLADRVGSRTLFLASVIGFIIASMLCGVATSLPEMVVFRALQGIAAAFMSPLSQTVMMDINPPSKQANAMSIWGMGVMVAPVLGPILGGYLTENFSWRWVFFVNVPVGILCLAIMWPLLPGRPIRKRSFDSFGFSMLALAIAAFQLTLDRGEAKDWFESWEVIIEILIGVAATWMFAVHMATTKTNRLFDRELFRNRNLVVGLGFMFVNGVLMMATMALLPTMMQGLFGYSVLDTGLLLMPRGVGVICSMYIAGRLLAREIDPRIMIGLGLAIAAASLYDMTGWTIQMGATSFIISGFVQGVGLGLVFIPLNLTAFGTLPPKYRTDAAGLLNLFRNIGASVGISAVTTLLARNLQISHMELGSHITAYSLDSIDPTITSILGSVGTMAMEMINGEVTRQAAMIAYLDDFKLMMILTACAVPLVMLLKRPPRRKAGDEAVHVAFE